VSEADDLQRVLHNADVTWCREWGDEWSTGEFLAHLAAAAIVAGWTRSAPTSPRGDSGSTP
jgi:hypothetical protein